MQIVVENIIFGKYSADGRISKVSLIISIPSSLKIRHGRSLNLSGSIVSIGEGRDVAKMLCACLITWDVPTQLEIFPAIDEAQVLRVLHFLNKTPVCASDCLETL